ncbi:metal ion transporter [Penicillium diatomitis]|uniref:Metal ion transporter n=1 Tax=Penicillium diatomitis TaxID=2819901 RepID=A0A9W9X7A8_9EURO|nr:metal ion transporter [Penicillium diatomitis]KAJ5485406.1 metal ion transporter [Penicillium diatomitis]
MNQSPAKIPETRPGAPASDNAPAQKPSKSAKRRKNRKGKRRNRQQSFLTPKIDETDEGSGPVSTIVGGREMDDSERPTSRDNPSYFTLRRKHSNTSLESDALLDHRDQPMMRPRRDSRLAGSFRPGSLLSGGVWSNDSQSRNTPRTSRTQQYQDSDSENENATDRTPLVRGSSGHTPGQSRYGTDQRSIPFARPRRASVHTLSPRGSPRTHQTPPYSPDLGRDYDVNNPPSIPGTPKLGPDMNYDDAVVTGAEFEFALARSMETRRESMNRPNDALIDVDGGPRQQKSEPSSIHSGQYSPQELRRRRTVTLPVEEDVCFPTEDVSEFADEERQTPRDEQGERRRRRRRQWPDLDVLEEWSRGEKEDRNGDLRVKKISEPVLVEGRLRPQYKLWRREEDDTPYRFTYFNEEFQSTIHAQTISELVQPGGSFRELFIPDPPELEYSSSEDEDDVEPSVNGNPTSVFASMNGAHWSNNHETQPASTNNANHANTGTGPAQANPETKNSQEQGSGTVNSNRGPQNQRLSIISETRPGSTRDASPSQSHQAEKPKRYGPRPTFWLDVLSPTDAEMRVIAKAFGIHALTAEDIMMQEAREKVELFRSYYFVNYRTFEQDQNSENYLEPVNMYVVVFREGVISFHFSQTPHPANVRRRIRQLMDYLILSSDWISYALIDDITDVFGPLIQAIEDEVDEIDEIIMKMHSSTKDDVTDNEPPSFAPGEMLRRTGECRKKVMGLYRLLSNKADVVKGFAKRCNEQWEVAPKSEIGLYLGDIQDHIMTMTGNLTHYETILSRAHSNYLAQINILMNERQEQTADVLGKLTVLGTIVLPMNIICGMWGMNVKVPGQDIENLNWFWSITAGLLLFGLASFLIAKRVYKIV